VKIRVWRLGTELIEVPPPISPGNDETPAGAIIKLSQMPLEERANMGGPPRARGCPTAYRPIV